MTDTTAHGTPEAIPVDPALYPDVADTGGLVSALYREASGQGLELGPLVAGAQPGALVRAKAVTGRGTFLVAADRDTERAFDITVWAPGVHLGTGSTGDLAAAAAAVHDWQSGRPVGEMAAAWPFIDFDRLAEAHVEGRAVITAWRLMRERDPGVRLADPELTEAAYAEPRLRVLFPFPTHGGLQFSGTTRDPYTHDLPSIEPLRDGWRVRGADASTLGEVPTAPAAVALVVAHLPDGCGPAVEGRLPEG